MSPTMEYPCDLCGKTEALEVPYVRFYTNNQPIHICSNCGFVYVKNRRSEADIAQAWNEIFDQNAKFDVPYSARIPAIKARQVFVADFIDTKISLAGKKLIDIGAGEGQFLSIVRDDYGAQPFGIEPFLANCNSMQNDSIPCFKGTIGEFQESSHKEKFDIATLMWTLECCVSCMDALDATYDCLEEGGHIVIATGSRILVPFKKSLRNYFGTNPVDTHCSRFSANTLQGVLALKGFATKHINRYWDSDWLCVIAEKQSNGPLPWKGDNPLKVHDFFERWHKESLYYEDFWQI